MQDRDADIDARLAELQRALSEVRVLVVEALAIDSYDDDPESPPRDV